MPGDGWSAIRNPPLNSLLLREWQHQFFRMILRESNCARNFLYVQKDPVFYKVNLQWICRKWYRENENGRGNLLTISSRKGKASALKQPSTANRNCSTVNCQVIFSHRPVLQDHYPVHPYFRGSADNFRIHRRVFWKHTLVYYRYCKGQ